MHSSNKSIELLWGAEAIAKEIGVNRRKAFHLLERGMIPARKLGKHWVAECGMLRAFFLQEMTQTPRDASRLKRPNPRWGAK